MEIRSKWRWNGRLYVRVFDPDGWLIEDRGLVSDRVITDDFAKYYIDCLHGGESGIANFKYHDSGTGTTAEDETDEGLENPTGVARIEGSQGEGATRVIYRTVAIITYDAAYEITEWGLFNALTNGIMMDRAVVAAITVATNYQVEWTYDHEALSGG